MIKYKENFGSILNREKLNFKNNKQLEQYYEKKWATEGYKKGYKLFGINISKIIHKQRLGISFDFLKPKKDEIILDAGCGNGDLALKIAKKSKVFAVDISKNAFFCAKNKTQKNLTFLKMNIEHLKFKNKMFDKIVCVETLEHVLHPEKVLKEFSRVIKQKGKLILTYPTIDKTIIAKTENFFRIRSLTNVSEHMTEWDYNAVIKKLEKYNFKFIEAKGIFFDLGRLNFIKKISKKIMLLVLKIELYITNFPKNSLFVAFVFEKNK